MMKLFLSSVFGLVTLCPAVFACSRVTWTGPVSDKSVVITGRSMDWPYGFNSHFHVYPRGEKVDGAGGDNSLSFETLYGSVLLSGSTDIGGPVDAVFDGMNEEGLVANLLYLAENDFGNITDSERPRLSFAAWTLYLLSQFSNVNEVVADVQKDAIQIVPINFGPGGAAHATVHMTVSDASGDSAVIEYLDGKPVVHHGPEYKVRMLLLMTSPVTRIFVRYLLSSSYYLALSHFLSLMSIKGYDE
jgi:choloylglycine hydrolase